MANEVDAAIEKAELELRKILTSIRLEDTEKAYVNETARRLMDVAYEALQAVPEGKRWQMRGIVLAVAIAMIIGPTGASERGVDMYAP